MPSAYPLPDGTTFVNQPSNITGSDPISTYADDMPYKTDDFLTVTNSHANIQAITDSHKGIAIDRACGFICTLGPLCNEKVKIVTDTGAISTLVSAQTVNESIYLSELTKEPIRERVYYAGNDGTIISKYMIRIF